MKKIYFLYLLVGLIVGSGITIALFKNRPKPQVTVTGTVLFQEKQAQHITGSCPEGYYLECSALNRVYLNHDKITKHRGRAIWAKGYLQTVQGPDGVLTFPLLMITQLTEANTMPE